MAVPGVFRGPSSPERVPGAACPVLKSVTVLKATTWREAATASLLRRVSNALIATRTRTVWGSAAGQHRAVVKPVCSVLLESMRRDPVLRTMTDSVLPVPLLPLVKRGSNTWMEPVKGREIRRVRSAQPPMPVSPMSI